ncbi:MAG: hypothetical protein ACMVY4_12785 [Minwuia sp.]|uniref:hypothetical protein n=1 Tax=Minwuia sp. TaxID=2493630 RepID=UPI003A8B0648
MTSFAQIFQLHYLCGMKPWFASIAILVVLLASGPSTAGESRTELIMFEQQNCNWCEEWLRVIGPIYPKTTEGRRAPIRRVDIHAPMPDDLEHIESSRFTPTFVLMHEGVEIGRIRGYPGEDFFWGLLGQMMQKLPPEG